MDWLLWIDLETSGLNPDTDKILQIAVVLSSLDLTKQYFLGEYTIYHDLSTLTLNDWCKAQHSISGLLNKVCFSQLSLTTVEQHILKSIYKHIKIKDKLYIAGNSVHFDKQFLLTHMPQLHCILQHRILDVSSLKLFFQSKSKAFSFSKTYAHTAHSDILESIQEYKYYLENCNF